MGMLTSLALRAHPQRKPNHRVVVFLVAVDGPTAAALHVLTAMRS